MGMLMGRGVLRKKGAEDLVFATIELVRLNRGDYHTWLEAG